MQRRFESFIFDFDGVIADTEALWFECLLSFAERHLLPVSRREMEDCVGDGDTRMMDLLTEGLGSREALDALYPELREDFAERTRTLRARKGLMGYLSYAQRNSISVACASSSHRAYIDGWFTRLGLLDRFKVIVTRDDVGKDKVKPCPDIYIKALERLGVAPSACLAFEDSPIGIRAAEAAGIFCVSVPNAATAKKTALLPNIRLDMSELPPERLLQLILSGNYDDGGKK